MDSPTSPSTSQLKTTSLRRRIKPPRLATALRESGQDRLHHTTMGWPSTGSVCWGQLPAVSGYRQSTHGLPTALTQADCSSLSPLSVSIISSSGRGQRGEWKGFQPASDPRQVVGQGKMVLNDGISGGFPFNFFF